MPLCYSPWEMARFYHRTINIPSDFQAKLLAFRGLLMSRFGIDLDYSTALLILAREGFESIQKSKPSESFLASLSLSQKVDAAALKSLQENWPRTIPTPPSSDTAPVMEKEKPSRGSTTKMPNISAMCFSRDCKVQRIMLNPQIKLGKNGKKVVVGKCPVCSRGVSTVSSKAVEAIEKFEQIGSSKK